MRRHVLWKICAFTSLIALVGCNDSGGGDAPPPNPDVNPSQAPVSSAKQIYFTAKQDDGTTILYRAAVSDANDPNTAKALGAKLSIAVPPPVNQSSLGHTPGRHAAFALRDPLGDLFHLPATQNAKQLTLKNFVAGTSAGEIILRDALSAPYLVFSPADGLEKGTVVLRNRHTNGVTTYDAASDALIFFENRNGVRHFVRRNLSGEEQATPVSSHVISGDGFAFDVTNHIVINAADFSSVNLDDLAQNNDLAPFGTAGAMMQRPDGSAWVAYSTADGSLVLHAAKGSDKFVLSPAVAQPHLYTMLGFIAQDLVAYRVAVRDDPNTKHQHTQLRVFDLAAKTAQTLVDYDSPDQWRPELAAFSPLYFVNGVHGKVGDRYLATVTECQFGAQPFSDGISQAYSANDNIDPTCGLVQGKATGYLLAWVTADNKLLQISKSESPFYLLMFLTDRQIAITQDANGVNAVNVADGANAKTVSLAGAQLAGGGFNGSTTDPALFDRMIGAGLRAQLVRHPIVPLDQPAQHTLLAVSDAQITADAITPLTLGTYTGTVTNLNVVNVSNTPRAKALVEDTTAPTPDGGSGGGGSGGTTTGGSNGGTDEGGATTGGGATGTTGGPGGGTDLPVICPDNKAPDANGVCPPSPPQCPAGQSFVDGACKPDGVIPPLAATWTIAPLKTTHITVSAGVPYQLTVTVTSTDVAVTEQTLGVTGLAQCAGLAPATAQWQSLGNGQFSGSFTLAIPATVPAQYICTFQFSDAQNHTATLKAALYTPALCGDGIVQAPEVCDDGNQIPNDGCSNSCTLPKCGDGIVQTTEECDDGNQVVADACTNSCKLPKCGDGIIQAGIGETCDDSNAVDGDGCSSKCVVESPAAAVGPWVLLEPKAPGFFTTHSQYTAGSCQNGVIMPLTVTLGNAKKAVIDCVIQSQPNIVRYVTGGTKTNVSITTYSQSPAFCHVSVVETSGNFGADFDLTTPQSIEGYDFSIAAGAPCSK